MNALSLLLDTVPQVASVVPDDDMIDGTQYRFTFEYQDFGLNPVSSTVKNLIYYSGLGKWHFSTNLWILW